MATQAERWGAGLSLANLGLATDLKKRLFFTADNLKRYGGFIPGIRPGKQTQEYLDYVLTRITVVGAAYLTAICLIPEYFIARAGIPLYLGGTSLLIVVNVTMDTVTQIQSHLIAHPYGSLIKTAKLKGARAG